MDRKRKAVVHVRRVNADCAIYSDKIVHAKFVVVVVVVVVWICFYYVLNNLDKFNLKKNIKRGYCIACLHPFHFVQRMLWKEDRGSPLCQGLLRYVQILARNCDFLVITQKSQ